MSKENFITDNKKFKDWIDSHPVKDHKDVIDLVIEKCKITKYTYQNWRNKNITIPPLAKDVINEIAGYDIFTEKEAAQVEEWSRHRTILRWLLPGREMFDLRIIEAAHFFMQTILSKLYPER